MLEKQEYPKESGFYWKVNADGATIAYVYFSEINSYIVKPPVYKLLGRTEEFPLDIKNDVSFWYGPIYPPDEWFDLHLEMKRVKEEVEKQAELMRIKEQEQRKAEKLKNLRFGVIDEFTSMVYDAQNLANEFAKHLDFEWAVHYCSSEDYNLLHRLFLIPFNDYPLKLQNVVCSISHNETLDRNISIFSLFFVQGVSAKSISKRVGLSKTRVCKLIRSIITRMMIYNKEDVINFIEFYEDVPHRAKEDINTNWKYINSIMDSFIH